MFKPSSKHASAMRFAMRDRDLGSVEEIGQQRNVLDRLDDLMASIDMATDLAPMRKPPPPPSPPGRQRSVKRRFSQEYQWEPRRENGKTVYYHLESGKKWKKRGKPSGLIMHKYLQEGITAEGQGKTWRNLVTGELMTNPPKHP